MPKAIRLHQTGGPEVLGLEEFDPGKPAAGEVQLRHTAIGLNFIDVYDRTGLYPMPLPAGLGREAAGVITALGRGDANAAEALHRAAFAAKQKVLGDDSPYTATARYRRALALMKLGRSEEARVELDAALTTRRTALGPDHPDTKAAERALRDLRD